MDRKAGTLHLILETPYGNYRVAWDLDDLVLHETIGPKDAPAPFELPLLGLEGVALMVRRRMLRADRLEQMARKLARQLAEYMEDSEGWHGEDRRESARRTVDEQR